MRKRVLRKAAGFRGPVLLRPHAGEPQRQRGRRRRAFSIQLCAGKRLFPLANRTSKLIGRAIHCAQHTVDQSPQSLPETAGIETHTGAKGFRNTPVWADHLLTDTEKTTVFTGSAKEAIATFPRRVNVAVATSLATTGPEITGVTLHSVPGWVGDDHCITAEIEGVKAVVDICSSTSAIAGWSVVALLRNLASPICFY